MKMNVYLSMKRLARVPRMAPLIQGNLNDGRAFVLGLIPGEPPALGFTVARQRGSSTSESVRISAVDLTNAIASGEARTRYAWTTLLPDPQQPGLWGNELVTVRRHVLNDEPGFVHLSWHWRDRAPFPDWRVGMKMKAQLCGPDWWAVEHYPAEDAEVDQANEYHLWCFSPTHPLHALLRRHGYDEGRIVKTQAEGDALAEGGLQRDPE